jgi:hypothetical protein
LANYIDQEILCEAYTHFDIELFNDKAKLERIRTDMTRFMEERAQFMFGDTVRVKVDFEHGSLKTCVTVFGTAATVILTAVSGYGSFRAGIEQATKDATMLAQSANLELIFRTKTASCDRIRIEKRKGVLGRIDSLLDELDLIGHNISNSKLPRNEQLLRQFNSTVDQLITWEQSVDKLFTKIENADTEACIAAGLLEELEKFPDAAPWADQLVEQSFKATVIASDTDRAAQTAALATKFAVVVKAIKKNLKIRLKNYETKKA